MTNKRKWLGILAIVLVFGQTVVGCDDSDDNGYFTLTGIPTQYNGMFASLSGSNNYDGENIYGFNTYNASTLEETNVLISNGSVRLPIWQGQEEVQPWGTTRWIYRRYYPNGTFDVTIYIHQDSVPDYGGYGVRIVTGRSFASVQFSNGSATRAWNAGTSIF